MFIYHFSGCDASGKSTHVKELSKILQYNWIHFDKPKDLEDGKNQYFNFLNNLNENIICDRLHDGEWVYAPIFRGYKGNYLKEFEQRLVQKFNYLFIYVKAELETIKERARKRGEDFVKEKHFKTVLDYFDQYLEEQSLPFIIIDTTNSKVKDNIVKVIESSNKINVVWNLIRQLDANYQKILPRGNVNAENMIISLTPNNVNNSLSFSIEFDEKMINKIKEKNMYKNSWITSIIPFNVSDEEIKNINIKDIKHILEYQISFIQPKKIISVDDNTQQYLKQHFNINSELL